MLKLYNTLTRQKEDFVPIKSGEVKIYSCGPTVYSFQHIGNMRAAIFQDTVRRSMKFLGFKVTSVQNFTDVGHLVSDSDEGEDKMLKASKKENKNPYDIAKFYTNAYLSDLKRLNVELPTFMPKATDEIPEQIEIISKLFDKGFAYKTSDGIYFDVSKFDEYGKLSGQSLEEKQAGARVEVVSEKRNPQDFALWKFLIGDNLNHIMKWDAPFGVGFPGWHIECSAMSAKYLGKEIDIHTGGIEHIPVHHENEIAQNACSGCVDKINFWMHNAHLQVDGEKMAKSSGTAYLLSEITDKGYSALAFRELCLRTHYRKSLNFTFESLKAGEVNVRKINDFYSGLRERRIGKGDGSVTELLKGFEEKFVIAIEDDLNTAVAMSVVFDFMSEVNKVSNLSKKDLDLVIEMFEKFDLVLGLLDKEDINVPLEVMNLIEMRAKVRVEKDWNKSDELRDLIFEKGFVIKDDKSAKEGYVLTKV